MDVLDRLANFHLDESIETNAKFDENTVIVAYILDSVSKRHETEITQAHLKNVRAHSKVRTGG